MVILDPGPRTSTTTAEGVEVGVGGEFGASPPSTPLNSGTFVQCPSANNLHSTYQLTMKEPCFPEDPHPQHTHLGLEL